MNRNISKLHLIAHRINIGDEEEKNNYVDNSLESVKNLINRKKDSSEFIKGFECDVRLTQDKELIIIHEGSMKALNPQKLNKNISDFSYRELQEMYIHDATWYYNGLKLRSYILPDGKIIRKIINNKLSQNTIISKAYDMFEYLAQQKYKGEILLELKEQTDECMKSTIKLINKYKKELNIIIQSYDGKKVLEIGKQTKIKMGILDDFMPFCTGNQKEKIDSAYIKNKEFDFYSICWNKLTRKKLLTLVDKNKELYIWTIDSIAHLWIVLKKLEHFYNKYGILPKNINLITNIPILLQKYLLDDNINIIFAKSIRKKYNKLFRKS